jgi:hypothetical protein
VFDVKRRQLGSMSSNVRFCPVSDDFFSILLVRRNYRGCGLGSVTITTPWFVVKKSMSLLLCLNPHRLAMIMRL